MSDNVLFLESGEVAHLIVSNAIIKVLGRNKLSAGKLMQGFIENFVRFYWF